MNHLLNKQETDILCQLRSEPFINQGILSDLTGHSADTVNRTLKKLIVKGYLTSNIQAFDFLSDYSEKIE